MSNSRESVSYKLPESLEDQARVIKLIPDAWGFMNGDLHATRRHHEEGRILRNSRLVFGDKVCQGVQIIRTGNEGGLPYEDLPKFRHESYHNQGGTRSYELFFKDKLVSSIGFSHAGPYHGGAINMPDVKEVISYYIGLGYKGDITAVSRYDDEGDELSSLVLSHWSNIVSVGRDSSRNYKKDKEEFDILVGELDKLGLQRKSVGVLA